MTPPQGPVSRAIRWGVRHRASRADVQRYTRFVGIMKRALPMAAAALLAAVIAYALQPRLQNTKRLAMAFERLGIVSNDLAMTKPRLTGIDSDGDPFVVTADQAIQDAHNGRRAKLSNVEADVTLKSGSWLNTMATRGELDATAQTLRLGGVIDLYSDNGYELHTTTADIDMHKGTIVGNEPVSGQGPAGTFRADRFVVRSDEDISKTAAHGRVHDGKRIFLYGHIHMTLFQKQAKHK